MLGNDFFSRAICQQMVLVWLRFAEREAREVAAVEAVLDGEFDRHLSDIFTAFADRELAILMSASQEYAEGLLEGLLLRNPYYKGERKKDERKGS